MKNTRLLTLLIVGVVAAWLFTFLAVYASPLEDWAQRGQFGDLFGSLNSLFSGLAFAALFFTLRLQQQQLEKQEQQLDLQRKELGLQREEMIASRTELAKQAVAQKHLSRATVAQIRVAAINAQIEAVKIRPSSYGNAEAHKNIEQAAEVLAELAKLLEREQAED
jgi:hypothetical protein